jgi:cystathionine beta-lyase/cystathionine gamma-synthase
MLRGLRTLAVRMQRTAQTTQQVIAFLEHHPRIRKVYYPHATSNPQFELAQKQMHGASGLLTIRLQVGDVAAVERFCNAMQRFLMTVSWGGYEALAFPVCAAHPANAAIDDPAASTLNLVRLSIGLEEPDALIADLAQALAAI